MGTPDFHHAAPFLRFVRRRFLKPLNAGQKMFANTFHCRYVHGRRKRIVRGLTHIDMIVGMDRLLASNLSTDKLNGTVRDHLVDVHVRLSTNPACQRPRGNSSSSLPAIISSATLAIRSAFHCGKHPKRALTMAAAFLMYP